MWLFTFKNILQNNNDYERCKNYYNNTIVYYNLNFDDYDNLKNNNLTDEICFLAFEINNDLRFLNLIENLTDEKYIKSLRLCNNLKTYINVIQKVKNPIDENYIGAFKLCSDKYDFECVFKFIKNKTNETHLIILKQLNNNKINEYLKTIKNPTHEMSLLYYNKKKVKRRNSNERKEQCLIM